jgi:hypothetical protein
VSEQTPVAAPPPSPSAPDDSWGEALAYPLACAGAVLGVIAGMLAFKLGLHFGIYGLIVIGPAAGYAARLLANFGTRRSDWILGAMAAVIAAAGALYTEWFFFPFQADASLPYFLQHLAALRTLTWLSLIVGTLMAFYLAWRK